MESQINSLETRIEKMQERCNKDLEELKKQWDFQDGNKRLNYKYYKSNIISLVFISNPNIIDVSILLQ